MRNLKDWAWLLFFGSLWGISEVVGGGFLYNENVAYSSVWLSAWALLVLAIARGIINKPGSSTIIAGFAVIFKMANTSPFFCHLLGIFTLGLVFDLAASFLMKKEEKRLSRSMLSGVISAYGGYAFFALFITYIVRYEYWVTGGLSKVLNHIFVSGSLAALAALVVVPLGYWIGVNSESITSRRPEWTYAGTLAGIIVLWTLARII